MKKVFFLMTFAILTLSCSSEEELEDNPDNSTVKGNGKYTLNSNEKNTNYAYWYNFSEGATFSLKNVELSTQDEVYSDISDTVWFDLRPKHNQTITEGTYTFSKTGGFPLYIQDGGHNSDEFERGTVTISKNGNNYTVVYDIELESGKTITGNYNGVINIVFD